METHSELNQTSKMDIFVKIVNGWKRLTIFAKSSILVVWLRFWIHLWVMLIFSMQLDKQENKKLKTNFCLFTFLHARIQEYSRRSVQTKWPIYFWKWLKVKNIGSEMLGERFEVMKLAQTNASYQPIFNQCTTSAPSENRKPELYCYWRV